MFISGLKEFFCFHGSCFNFFIALSWLRGSVEVHDEMDDMRAEYEAMKLLPKVTLRDLLTNDVLRIPMIIAIVMMLAQQLSGINAVSYLLMYLSKE